MSTRELEELRQVTRAFLAGTRQGTRSAQDRAATVLDQHQWQRMTKELEVLRLAVPAQFGGQGFGLTQLGLVFEEAGRVLLSAPLLSNFLAIDSLLGSRDEDVAPEFLESICSGKRNGAVAWLGESGRAVAGLRMHGGRLYGTVGFVIDGQTAGLVLVLAEGSLCAVEAQSRRVSVTRQPFFDPTRSIATINFDGAECRRLGRPGDGDGILKRSILRATALITAEQLGGAIGAMESAVDYAKTRRQFGRPIGANQALKHRLADLYVKVEAARSAVTYALTSADERPRELAIAASVAKACASETFLAAAAENMQIHGAMGFTDEDYAHLFLRRAKADAMLFGDPREHRERLARAILDHDEAGAQRSASQLAGEAEDPFSDQSPLDLG